jgi:hypothetical protein
MGKKATAPCGHEGEHVFNNYVKCLRGCDDTGSDHDQPLRIAFEPEPEPEKTRCLHSSVYHYDGDIWCYSCGARVKV